MERYINRLSDKARDEFQKKADRLVFGSFPEAKELINAAKSLLPILEKDKPFFEKSRMIVEGKYPYLIYENLPVDGGLLVPPVNGKRPDSKISWVSEMILLSITILSGYCPFSFREEKGEELIHQIAPSQGKEETMSNSGIIPLPWHTDDSILPEVFRPAMLMLIGLVNEGALPTGICVADDALSKMSPKQLAILSGSNFRLRTPDSFDDALKGMKIQSAWKSIISIDSSGSFRAGGNLFAIEAKNDEAKKVLNLLQDELSLNETPIILQNGMALQFDNSRCFHRRGKLSSEKRWLQRSFGTNSIEFMRHTLGVDNETYIFDACKLIINELYAG